MKNKNTSATICVLLLVFYIAASSPDPRRVILVDKVGKNLLFRCNNPMNDTDFQYENLLFWMKNKTESEGYEFPTKYKMVVYSHLNEFSVEEAKYLNIEKKFFKENPDKGDLLWWPIFGNPLYSNQGLVAVRKYWATNYKKWNWDQMQIVIENMYNDLQNDEQDYVKLIVFHCIAGYDRTGQVFGGYMMTKKNWTYRQALIFDNNVLANRTIVRWSRNGLNLFCWYLHYTQNRGGDCTYEYPKDKQQYISNSTFYEDIKKELDE